MAETKRQFDWNDPKNLRQRAWESVKEFFGKDEPNHALSPELVARESKNTAASRVAEDFEDPNAERIHRPIEQRNINESPATTWPG